jgi:hypothetical protein
MIHIESAKYLDGYRIHLEFNTGESGEVDLTQMINRYAIAASLKDTEQFAKFYLDEWPTLAWQCGFDVAPETLYELATGKRVPWLQEA